MLGKIVKIGEVQQLRLGPTNDHERLCTQKDGQEAYVNVGSAHMGGGM